MHTAVRLENGKVIWEKKRARIHATNLAVLGCSSSSAGIGNPRPDMILVVAWDDELYIAPAPLLLYSGISSVLSCEPRPGQTAKHRARP